MGAQKADDRSSRHILTANTIHGASTFHHRDYRLGSSGQRILTSDKRKAVDIRSFTTSSTLLKKVMLSDNVREKLKRKKLKMGALSAAPMDAQFRERFETKQEEKNARRKERPRPRFTTSEEKVREDLSDNTSTNLSKDAEPFQIRKFLAAPPLQSVEEPEPAARLDGPGTQINRSRSTQKRTENDSLWLSHNDSKRTSQNRRLYQDQGPSRRTKDLPYIPVEGSSIIRYEASDKSQRLKDAYAMKKFEDGFVIRKHAASGVNITKHGSGESEVDMGKGREYDEEKSKNAVSAASLKKAVSAREYARGLHSEYRSSLGEWE